MPVVDVGSKLPSIYLDRFQPTEGVMYRLSVLDTRAIATEFHFLDLPARDIKGSYQCIQGVCCTACGRRSQSYNVPVYVYQNPTQNTGGEIQVWKMSAPQWKKFSDMAMQVDFKQYDIVLQASKRGWGLDMTYSVVPDVLLRQYWTPEQREQIPQSVESFYQLGEASLVNPMTFNDWQQLLYACGFDLQNMQWPGGVNPFSHVNARGAVGSAVAPMPPVAPSSGVLPPVPGMAVPPPLTPVPQFPGQVGGTILQPPALAPAPLPASVQAPAVPVSRSSGVSPGYGLTPTPVVNASPAQKIPQSQIPSPAPAQVFSPAQAVSVGNVTGGVPLGTVPVIPQSAPLQPAIPVPAGSVEQSNIVPGQQEITAAEMDVLLS
jgi:hypothetical protein